MINLSNIISQFLNDLNNNLKLESLYQFEFNEELLPFAIHFPTTKYYDRNIILKQELHNAWAYANVQTKGDIVEYYIKNWGGIRGNGITTMNQYRNQDTNQLLNRGYIGISSWSKALVIHNPEEYFIYDSRVAFTINCLQEKYNLNNKIKFDIPSGRGRLVGIASGLLNNQYNYNNWNYIIPLDEVYNNYLELINLISNNTGFSKSKIEMSLFSIAPSLASELIYNS
jgi:hypothetical protein